MAAAERLLVLLLLEDGLRLEGLEDVDDVDDVDEDGEAEQPPPPFTAPNL